MNLPDTNAAGNLLSDGAFQPVVISPRIRNWEAAAKVAPELTAMEAEAKRLGKRGDWHDYERLKARLTTILARRPELSSDLYDSGIQRITRALGL